MFKNPVEKELGCDICCLRTDMEGEFTSKEFNVFCVDHDIKNSLPKSSTCCALLMISVEKLGFIS